MLPSHDCCRFQDGLFEWPGKTDSNSRRLFQIVSSESIGCVLRKIMFRFDGLLKCQTKQDKNGVTRATLNRGNLMWRN
jgi:hypothetical protein